MSHSRLCRYCRSEFKPWSTYAKDTPTTDHVVPRWVLRLLPEAQRTNKFFQDNRVTACKSCNRRKGAMPAALFVTLLVVREPAVKGERERWDRLAMEFAKLDRAAANAHPLAARIVTEFLRPIPPHFAVKPVDIVPAVSPLVDWVRGA